MQIGCNFHRRSEQLSHHNCPPRFLFTSKLRPLPQLSSPKRAGHPHLNQPPHPRLVQPKWFAASCKFQRLEYPRRLRRADRGQVCIFAANRRFRAVIQPPKITRSLAWPRRSSPAHRLSARACLARVSPRKCQLARGESAPPRPQRSKGAASPLQPPAGPPTLHIRSLHAPRAWRTSLTPESHAHSFCHS